MRFEVIKNFADSYYAPPIFASESVQNVGNAAWNEIFASASASASDHLSMMNDFYSGGIGCSSYCATRPPVTDGLEMRAAELPHFLLQQQRQEQNEQMHPPYGPGTNSLFFSVCAKLFDLTRPVSTMNRIFQL